MGIATLLTILVCESLRRSRYQNFPQSQIRSVKMCTSNLVGKFGVGRPPYRPRVYYRVPSSLRRFHDLAVFPFRPSLFSLHPTVEWPVISSVRAQTQTTYSRRHREVSFSLLLLHHFPECCHGPPHLSPPFATSSLFSKAKAPSREAQDQDGTEYGPHRD
jgi:hypothetical protein